MNRSHTFSIHPQILKRYPNLRTGLLWGTVDNNTNPEVAQHILEAAQAEILQANDEHYAQLARIQRWKTAYKDFGAKPKKHLSSIENLSRTLQLGKSIRSINPVVDIYNSVSLKYMLPIGGDDLNAIAGNIQLALATGQEIFTALGSDVVTVPKPGEVIYKDEVQVLCRRWNWRECEQTKITASTTSICLVVEALHPDDYTDMTLAINRLQVLLTEHCGAKLQQEIISEQNSSVSISPAVN